MAFYHSLLPHSHQLLLRNHSTIKGRMAASRGRTKAGRNARGGSCCTNYIPQCSTQQKITTSPLFTTCPSPCYNDQCSRNWIQTNSTLQVHVVTIQEMSTSKGYSPPHRDVSKTAWLKYLHTRKGINEAPEINWNSNSFFWELKIIKNSPTLSLSQISIQFKQTVCTHIYSIGVIWQINSYLPQARAQKWYAYCCSLLGNEQNV